MSTLDTSLKVAICRTKEGPDADSCYTALASGIPKVGDNIKLCFNIDDVNSYSPDVIFMIGYASFNPIENRFDHGWPEWKINGFRWSEKNSFRIDIINWCKSNNRRVLIIDSPALKGSRKRNGSQDSYYMVTYDMPKGLGEYYPQGIANPDRFNKLNLQIKPWVIHKTNRCLVLGQLIGGTATQGIDIAKMYKYAFLHLKQKNKEMYYIEHPNSNVEYTNPKYKIKYVRNRENKFSGIECCVGFNSNAIIESILEGVPCIVLSRMSQAYSYCSNTLDDIDNPKTFDREGFLWNLAYSQWAVKEMRDGSMWSRYRPYSLWDYKGI